MELKNCRKCGQQVSTDTKNCPSCGVASPSVSTREIIVSASILIFFFGVILAQCSSGTEEDAKADASCKGDLQCWGDKNIIGAGVYCDDYVEKLAKFSVRWTDGTLEPKFSRFRWLDQETGTLTYVGDKIQFQNGFGAYQAYTYECDFDPASSTVLDVRAWPGRI